MEFVQHIILDNTLDRVADPLLAGYLCHAYCHRGQCELTYNNREFTLQAGDCMIIAGRSDLFSSRQPSDDFVVDVIYVTQEFIQVCTPQSNYGVRGHLSLFENPIMRLSPEQQRVCVPITSPSSVNVWHSPSTSSTATSSSQPSRR